MDPKFFKHTSRFSCVAHALLFITAMAFPDLIRAQEKIASNTIKIEATGLDCATRSDTVHQFAIKFADQPGLWTVYSPIAGARSIRIKGAKKYGISLVIAKVNLEADLCQLLPIADQGNKAAFDKQFPFAAGLGLAEERPLPEKLWHVGLSGESESFQAVGTKRCTDFAHLGAVPLEVPKTGRSTLPSFLKADQMRSLMFIADSLNSQQVIRRFVGGPVWGENWKKEGMLGIVGGVLPTTDKKTFIAWVIRPSDLMDKAHYQPHSVIPSSTREELRQIACKAKLPAVVTVARPIVAQLPVDTTRIEGGVIRDRYVKMMVRFRELRGGSITRSAFCGQGNLDISAAQEMTLSQAKELELEVLNALLICFREEYCRSKDKQPDRNRPDFRSKVLALNGRMDALSLYEMQILSEAGVSRLQVVEFAQELFVLSHHQLMMERAKADTLAQNRTLCKLDTLMSDLSDWREIVSRVPEYPRAWKDQVEDIELTARRLSRTMVDSLEAQMLRQPLTFEEIADMVERNDCLSPEDAASILARVKTAKQPDPAKKRNANITHAEKMRTAWSSRVKSIAARERLPKWDFSYVSYEDSLVMTLRFSGGKPVEEVSKSGKKDQKDAVRACSYGFPLGSCVYPECIPAVELFATFVEENYFMQDNGFAPLSMRIIGSADNTPIRSKLNYPPEILEDFSQVPDAANANLELAYARAFYARYILNNQPYQWPGMMAGSMFVVGIEVPEKGESHRNIQLTFVVAPRQ